MIIHKVKSGDNLWQISKKYNTSIESIVKINGLLQPNNLVIGMSLVIPTDERLLNYTVKSGDTLWGISKKFNANYKEIAKINNIRFPYYLYIGQNLSIPLKSNNTYVVKAGDILWGIAKKFNIPLSQLIKINNLSHPYNIYPGQILLIEEEKTIIETLGYYNPERLTDKTGIIRTLGKYLTYLGLFDFPINEKGDIIGNIDSDVLKVAELENVKILPVITNLKNGNFDRNMAYNVLSDTNTLNVFIGNILTLINKYDLLGIIIDIENMAPNDVNIFTNFIKVLHKELKQNNKILVLNIPPKWEKWADKDWVGFFDFNALAPHIDIAAIMTYEFGWRSGPPRPTVPMDYITRSLDYTLNNNITADKILLGFTHYGYDWALPDTSSNLAKTVTLTDVWNIARKYNSPIIFDEEEKQPFVEYKDDNLIQHKIWFENAKTHYLKYQLIKDYNLRGAFYWILNLPFPSTFYMMDKMFSIVKL